MNRLRTPLIVVGLATCAIVLSGCIGFHGPNDVRRKVARQNDVKLKQEFGISTNGMTLRMARGIASPFVDEKLPRLKGIRRVQYGEYEIIPLRGGSSEITVRDLELKGWERVVRVSDPKSGEEICVYAEERKGRLCGIVAIIRERDELKIARVKGNLEKFLANVMDHEWFDDINVPIMHANRKSREQPASLEVAIREPAPPADAGAAAIEEQPGVRHSP